MRNESAGQFVQLSDGVTHFEIDGPEDGDQVVLVHGILTPYFIYDHIFAGLVKAGYRVLRYDLFGRGLSDRPEMDYAVSPFRRQLYELLTEIAIMEPFYLTGSSMGGIAASNFAAAYPEKIKKLSLIAPSGFPDVPTDSEITSAKGNDSKMSVTERNLASNETLFYGCTIGLKESANAEAYRERFAYYASFKGFKNAALSTVTHTIAVSQLESYKKLDALNIPVQFIWGTADIKVPFTRSKMAREILSNAEFNALEGAGHLCIYDEPKRVLPLLISFFQK